MKNILHLINSNNTAKIKGLIDSLESLELLEVSTNDQLFIAEKLCSIAFSGDSPNLEFAQLSVGLYSKMYKLDSSSESTLFLALYIRLRILKETPRKEVNDFFSKLTILDAIRRKLEVPFSEIQNKASKWRSLKVREIKELRSYKMWVKLLMELEKVENEEYSEFNEWKKLSSILP